MDEYDTEKVTANVSEDISTQTSTLKSSETTRELKSHQDFNYHVTNDTVESSKCHPRLAKLRKIKNLEPLALPKYPPCPSPIGTTPSSPYCPSRTLGSTQRRAQRSPLTQFGGSFRNPYNPFEEKQSYRAPYVEDVTSPAKHIASIDSLAIDQDEQCSTIHGRYNSPGFDGGRSYTADSASMPRTATPRSPAQMYSAFMEGTREFEQDDDAGAAMGENYQVSYGVQSTHTSGCKTFNLKPLIDIEQSDFYVSRNTPLPTRAHGATSASQYDLPKRSQRGKPGVPPSFFENGGPVPVFGNEKDSEHRVSNGYSAATDRPGYVRECGSRSEFHEVSEKPNGMGSRDRATHAPTSRERHGFNPSPSFPSMAFSEADYKPWLPPSMHKAFANEHDESSEQAPPLRASKGAFGPTPFRTRSSNNEADGFDRPGPSRSNSSSPCSRYGEDMPKSATSNL